MTKIPPTSPHFNVKQTVVDSGKLGRGRPDTSALWSLGETGVEGRGNLTRNVTVDDLPVSVPNDARLMRRR